MVLKDVGGKSSLDYYANDGEEKHWNKHVVPVGTTWLRLFTQLN